MELPQRHAILVNERSVAGRLCSRLRRGAYVAKLSAGSSETMISAMDTKILAAALAGRQDALSVVEKRWMHCKLDEDIGVAWGMLNHAVVL